MKVWVCHCAAWYTGEPKPPDVYTEKPSGRQCHMWDCCYVEVKTPE